MKSGGIARAISSNAPCGGFGTRRLGAGEGRTIAVDSASQLAICTYSDLPLAFYDTISKTSSWLGLRERMSAVLDLIQAEFSEA